MQDDNEEFGFIGRGWSFPPVFSMIEGGVEMTSDIEDIKNSLHILLSTSVGERILQPKFGCNLKHLVFENLDTTMETHIKSLIEYAILHFEPRIELQDIRFESKEDNGRIDILIDFMVRSTNSRYNLVYPFYKEGGR